METYNSNVFRYAKETARTLKDELKLTKSQNIYLKNQNQKYRLLLDPENELYYTLYEREVKKNSKLSDELYDTTNLLNRVNENFDYLNQEYENAKHQIEVRDKKYKEFSRSITDICHKFSRRIINSDKNIQYADKSYNHLINWIYSEFKKIESWIDSNYITRNSIELYKSKLKEYLVILKDCDTCKSKLLL